VSQATTDDDAVSSGLTVRPRARRVAPRGQINGHSGRYLLSHTGLLLRVTWSDLGRRYAGSLLGVSWVIVAPAASIGLYAAIYRLVFRVQVPGLRGWDYVLYIFAGLVPYLMTAEALTSGVASVVANRSVLNNTVFPIDLAPVKAVLAAQGSMLAGMIATVAGVIAVGRAHWTILLLPVVWLLQIMALIGVSWVLSLVNVVLRDLQNLITLLLVLLMIASPIAYTPAMVPASLKAILYLNPLSYFVLTYQRILVLGQLPDLTTAVLLVVISIGLFLFGGYFFARTKSVMVDYV
jgi:lipopolysaccharide transport system permease protein